MSHLLQIDGLSKIFPVKKRLFRPGSGGIVRAVDNVSFHLAKGEALAIVGESGCGKSTLARLILRLIEHSEGDIRFEGRSITNLPANEMRKMRRRMQIVFQDPFSSLNPRMRARDIIEEPLAVHGLGTATERRQRVQELMNLVGFNPAWGERLPAAFSGGQRQRIGIARALALNPSLVILDEPVSALDVSIQAQVINLLMDLKAQLDLSYLFISHDLSVVEHIADRVAVMYLGRIVEIGTKQQIYAASAHPYTRGLLNSVPQADPARALAVPEIRGELPTPFNVPKGCRFSPRCEFAADKCRSEEPTLAVAASGHGVACHYPLAAATRENPGRDLTAGMKQRLKLYETRAV